LNDLTALMYTVLARAVVHLRYHLPMIRAINTDFSLEVKEHGDTIDVKVPTVATTYDVVPGQVAVGDAVPTGTVIKKVPIKLDNWKATNFKLEDIDQKNINADKDFLPMQTKEAISALGRAIRDSVLSHYPQLYYAVGTAAQTPFQDFAPPATLVHQGVLGLTHSRKLMQRKLVPDDLRHVILDPDAAGNLLSLQQFNSIDSLGAEQTRTHGEFVRRYGMDIHEELWMPQHAAGTLTGTVTVTGANSIGVTTVGLTTAGASSFDAKVGDLIQFAGDDELQTVTEAVTIGASATGAVKILPGLRVATAGGEGVSMTPSHAVNIFAHQMCFALAVRPLVEGLNTGNGQIISLMDNVTGIPIRLEVKRQNKQTVWEFDALWGDGCPLPHLGGRLLG